MKLPYLTFYTDNLPPNTGGTAQGPVVKIKNKYKEDAGLHAHEYTHVKQWYRMLGAWLVMVAIATVATFDLYGYLLAELSVAGIGLHGLLYLVFSRYRLMAEAEAYAAQVKPDKSDLDLMAYRLSMGYDLGISVTEAKKEIEARL